MFENKILCKYAIFFVLLTKEIQISEKTSNIGARTKVIGRRNFQESIIVLIGKCKKQPSSSEENRAKIYKQKKLLN